MYKHIQKSYLCVCVQVCMSDMHTQWPIVTAYLTQLKLFTHETANKYHTQ